MNHSIQQVHAETLAGLREIGYQGPLLEEKYKFPDWFTRGREEREVAFATFGQTPISYDSACIGVAASNGLCGAALVDQYRALGAPVFLEIARDEIREWAVSRRESQHGLIDRYPINQIRQMFANRASDWRPQSLLRAKNIGSFRWCQQIGLFSGLLPELEEQIQEQLDPLLRSSLAATKEAYVKSAKRDPDPTQLFKLVFWILTAKVFHDRRISAFEKLGPNPDELLSAVARQYQSEVPSLLNREARNAATSSIWNRLDFRNLSVDVLSEIWSTTLVDDSTRKRLGIHRTPRTVARYLVERIPFEHTGDDKQIILEPCSGSAVFLISAMNEIRPKLFGMTPAERHNYFVHHLAAIEKDAFGVEISRLALTLADFPNPGGWDITHRDVFEPGVLTPHLRRAGVVLCNPPFEDFDKTEKQPSDAVSTKKPVELLSRVLRDLHPTGIIGFILPSNFVDGRGYAEVRKRLAERFATLELTILPDRVFESDAEVTLLLATDPIPHHICRVTNRRVHDDPASWKKFELEHEVSTDHSTDITVVEARSGLVVPELAEVWDFLLTNPKLDDAAVLGRGIEWNRPLTDEEGETGHRSDLVRSKTANGFRRGVAPQTAFNVFVIPQMSFLSLREDDQRGNAWQRDWDKPKVIVNKSRRHRGPWRLAAFPDSDGVTFYQTYIGAWPKSSQYDEFALSAILNSPVANAFVATRETKRDITLEMLKLIPLPYLTELQCERLRVLIQRYQRAEMGTEPFTLRSDQDRTLKEIDALVLDGYRMPPRLERVLLDFFRGHRRSTSHHFSDYVPMNCNVYFSLSEYLSPEFAASTSGELLKRMAGGIA